MNIYGLQYDYVQRHGTYLIVSNEEGLDLEDGQVEAVQSDHSSGLLALDIVEQDFQIKLRYNITSKRRLSEIWRGQKVTLLDYYHLLLQIVSAMDDGNSRMLKEQHYILKEEFIYIGDQLKDVSLAYLPLQMIPGKASVREELKHLSTNLIGEVEDMDGLQFEELLRYFKDDQFSISGLKQKLIDMIESYADREKSAVEQAKGLRIKRVVSFLAFLLTAGIWVFYLSSPQGSMQLYLSIGFTILSAGLVFLLLKPKKKRKELTVRKDAVLDDSENQIKQDSKSALSTAAEARGAANKENQSMHSGTVPLGQHKETVMLSSTSSDQASTLQPRPFLEIHRNAKAEQIEIVGERFVIGRNPELADYAEADELIGRKHLEILWTGTGYGVRDLGSRNGSYLNQERLVANKVYPVKHGDRIQAARKEYIFKYPNPGLKPVKEHR